MRTIYRRFPIWIIFIAFLFLGIQGSYGANRLYFGGISTFNEKTNKMMVVLVWGEMEGEIPAEITHFRIYRTTAGANDYTKIADIPNAVVDENTLKGFFLEPGEEQQKYEIISMLASALPEENVTEANFHKVLHAILDPADPAYNPFQSKLIIRYSRDGARGAGRAFIDKNVDPVQYTYMLTGVLADGKETKPLGKVTVDATVETILPAPADFVQVRVAGCSATRKAIDHRRIHLNWAVPTLPEIMALRILIYGYDLYRSEADLGQLDLRSGVPAELTKINDVPIVVSGNAPSEGRDAYLAVDDGDVLFGGEGLPAGKTFYYYLVARDLAGKYSHTAGPLEAVVPDTEAPVMPWNVHAQREEIESEGSIVPRLTLIWDQVNSMNYLKAYGAGKNICGSSSTQICYLPQSEACGSRPPICVDLEVVRYQVYRFNSFEEASMWGTDSDGDLWPNEKEDLDGDGDVDPGETDPCDPTSHPPGFPAQLVAQIDQNDETHIRTLDSGKKVHFFQDTVPQADNKVYWYRVSAEDSSGNRSPLSPPVRAALWNRTQPEPNGSVQVWTCDYLAKHHVQDCKDCNGESGAVLTILDETHGAAGHDLSFGLFEKCGDDKVGYQYRLIYRGNFNSCTALFKDRELKDYVEQTNCEARCDFVVMFFDRTGMVIAESPPFSGNPCTNMGCVVLKEECQYKPVDPVGPGPTIHDPSQPVKVCAQLQPGECARVYQEIGGKMSPIANFCNDGNTEANICKEIPLKGIVTMSACLGIRIFSKNHVGSVMEHLPCITVPSNPPNAPIIEGVIPTGNEVNPKFEVRWSAQSDGLSAFIISMEGKSGIFYETVWNPEPEADTGQFSHQIGIDPGTITDEWGFRVRALDSALQMSPWSSKQEAVWGEAPAKEYLPWPTVSEPPSGGEITAFVFNGEKVGALVLSDDVTKALQQLSGRDCGGDGENQVPLCSKDSSSCLGQSYFPCPGACSIVQSWNSIGRFVVYRQEEGKDFVQVSPLVDMLHCSEQGDQPSLDDPLIYLVRLGDGSVAGVDPEDKAALEGTTRLVFVDWYPFKSLTKVRYQVVKIDSASGEPEKVYISKWIVMPQ